MSIDYTLYVSDQVTSDGLLRIIEDELGLDHDRTESPPPYSPTLVSRPAPGFYLTATAMDSRSAEIIGEWLGFEPRVRAGFRMDKEGDFRGAFLGVLRATSAVLSRLTGDLVLAMNSERVYIIRRGGRVTAIDDPRVLDAAELSQIKVPYELGEVPGLP